MTDQRASWRTALSVAAVLIAGRLLNDLILPLHPRWWSTAAIAGSASLLTSAALLGLHPRPHKDKDTSCPEPDPPSPPA